MGAHILAIVVWLGSLSLYGAAFFFPEVHRRHDFLVSGLGAFYGLVLWFSAVQTSSTELLGQVASVGLLGWFGWQTLSLRRKRTPLELQTPLTADSWPAFGRQLKQSVFSWLRGTPLGRWLPAQGERGRGVEPYATGGIRVSSLKDVDYEFVDELASQPRPSPARVALAPAPKSPATAAPAPVSQAAVRPAPSPRPKPPSPPLPRPPAVAKPAAPSWGARWRGLQTWVGDLIKAKTAPKPKRAVIEIPPRPSPLAKSRPTVAPVKDDLPRRDANPEPPAGITIVDAAAVESGGTRGAVPETPEPPVVEGGAEAKPVTQDGTWPGDSRPSSEAFEDESPDGNWPEDDWPEKE